MGNLNVEAGKGGCRQRKGGTGCEHRQGGSGRSRPGPGLSPKLSPSPVSPTTEPEGCPFPVGPLPPPPPRWATGSSRVEGPSASSRAGGGLGKGKPVFRRMCPERGAGGWVVVPQLGHIITVSSQNQMRGRASRGRSFVVETSLATENSEAVSPVGALGAALPAPGCPPQYLALTRARSANPRPKGQCHERGRGPLECLSLRGRASPSRPWVTAFLSHLESLVHCGPIACRAL